MPARLTAAFLVSGPDGMRNVEQRLFTLDTGKAGWVECRAVHLNAFASHKLLAFHTHHFDRVSVVLVAEGLCPMCAEESTTAPDQVTITLAAPKARTVVHSARGGEKFPRHGLATLTTVLGCTHTRATQMCNATTAKKTE